ncbi:MAG: nitrite reductase [Thermoleophilia bacterium]|nr:nitrite reductase [Thermoleophilia bacterium]
MTPHTHTTSTERQRRVDFDTLAPLSIGAIIVAVVAIAIAIASHQDAGTVASAAGAGDAAATATSETTKAVDVKDVKPDFSAKEINPATEPVKAGPKTFELTATERKVKVGDKVYDQWTFNDQVPGPVMRVVVGDKVTIKIKNAGDSKLPHSVDFHSSRLTLGGGHVQVNPGDTGTYEFVAEYPGVFMYHCATAPVLHHIGMGMYGMMIVQPKEGFGADMPEYAIVQHELYASSKGIDDGVMDAMAFNGIPSHYTKMPIKVKKDARIRLFVLNAGPSQVSSFHVVGTVFDRVYEDGNPRNVSYGRQALMMPASGSGVFEFQTVGEGLFPFVTHQFNHAAKGAVGMIIAGDGKPGPGAIDEAKDGHH